MAIVAACCGISPFEVSLNDEAALEDVSAVASALKSLSVSSEVSQNTIRFYPKGSLSGGEIDIIGSNGFVFSMALASLLSNSDLVIENSEALENQYAGFWDRYQRHAKRRND